MIKLKKIVCEKSNCNHFRNIYGGMCCENDKDYYGNLRIGRVYLPETSPVPEWCGFLAEQLVSQNAE